MKHLNTMKSLFYTMLAVATATFSACVDDNVDEQAPSLELSETTLAFSGTATEDKTVTVKSNRQWAIAYEDEASQEWMYFKVTGNEVSTGLYSGDGTVKITVGESTEPHMGRLIFTLSNSYGELYRKYLTVTQGNYVPPTQGPVGDLVEYILGNAKFSGATGTDKAVALDYPESTIEAVILANDAAGNNNRKLYVGDNNGLERSAIVLYGSDFAMASDVVTKYPVGAKVTLDLSQAKYYTFYGLRQLMDVTVTVSDEKVELEIPSLSISRFLAGDYQGQYVKINNVTPEQSWVGKSWTATDSQSVIVNDNAGGSLTVYMNKSQYATGFAGAYIADKTGSIYGAADMHNDPQLAPTSKSDVAALSSDEGGSGEEPEPTPGDAIYFETFGSADASSRPLISTYTGWTKSGSGADEVTYTSTGNVSIRNSGKLSAGYADASGENKCFLGTNNPAFMINKIKTGSAQKLQLTFGGSYSKNTNGEYDNTFYTDKFHVSLSADGTTWVPVEYTTEQADQYWVFATSNFTLKNATTYLYVKFAADEASVFAIDDVRVAAGEGGTEIDLGEGGEEPEPTPGAAITVNELYQLAEQVTGKEKVVIDAANDRTLEAVVVTDAAGGNYTYNNLMVMAEGATQPKNGIMLFSSGQYTNPGDANFPFKPGDKVRFTLVKGLAKVANFNGTYEVTCEQADASTWLTAEVIGNVTLKPVELTSVDNLADYQGMLVTVKNATSPASAGNWAVGTTTFKVGSSDLTVYVKNTATAFSGKQYPGSTTGDLTGYVSLYNGAPQLCPRNMDDVAAFTEGGGTDPEPEPSGDADITLDFTRGVDMATPAFPYHDKDDSSSATEGTYTIDGYTYNIKASSDGKFYWFYNNYNEGSEYEAFYIGKIGAYIELPAIAGKALTKVVLTGASGASSTSEASITDTTGADVAGGLTQVVGTGVATYELSGTTENTSYRITITKNSCQFAKIELYYGEGGGSTPSAPTLSVNPTSLSFAAKDSAKTISCTPGNASGYTVGATSSDPTNFPAVASGTTVTVTPTENTASSTRSATITVYLTNDGGSTKVATQTVSVTQAAAGGETQGDTYEKITTIASLSDGITGFIGGEVGSYGLNLVNGMSSYGQAYTSEYTYDETAKTLTQVGDYTAVEFTLEAVSGGYNIKVGNQYLVGTVIMDSGKAKQALAFSDTPANAWVFEDYETGIVARTDASNELGTFNGMYMMLAKTATSRFIRAYQSLNATSGAGFWFFKKN